MAEPFAKIAWLGRQVACYLQPGTQVADLSALTRDAEASCRGCESLPDLQVKMQALAERHGLAVEYTGPRVPADAVERLVSFGFMPPVR
jgi:hypothetical protein